MVAFDGMVTDIDTKEQYPQLFLEISDCKTKVRLHQTSDDTREDFIIKMELLKHELVLFINHLENKETK